MKPSTFIKNAGLDAGWLETLFVNLLYRLLRFRLVFRQHLLTEREYEISHPLLLPADFILVGEFRRLGQVFNRSAFTHVLVYVGNGECIHADGLGVRRVTFRSLFDNYDTLSVMRVQGLTDEQQTGIVKFVEGQVGRPFDFWFDKRDTRAWYCTELICAALRDKDICLPLCSLNYKFVLKPAEFAKGLTAIFTSRYIRVKDNEFEFTYY